MCDNRGRRAGGRGGANPAFISRLDRCMNQMKVMIEMPQGTPRKGEGCAHVSVIFVREAVRRVCAETLLCAVSPLVLLDCS
jgi:hypothetical protein